MVVRTQLYYEHVLYMVLGLTSRGPHTQEREGLAQDSVSKSPCFSTRTSTFLKPGSFMECTTLSSCVSLPFSFLVLVNTHKTAEERLYHILRRESNSGAGPHPETMATTNQGANRDEPVKVTCMPRGSLRCTERRQTRIICAWTVSYVWSECT